MQNTCSPSNGPSMESRPEAWNFKRLFQPKSVAVIGVSLERDRHPANVIFNKIQLRYPVDVFAVNPRGGELFGQKVYTGIQDLPQPVDLAIIAVRAVSSHTASMAGDYAVFSAALAQHGIVEAANEIELVSFCEALSCYQEPIDGRVGIISSGGGHGALAVDICSRHGLSVPAFNQQQQARIRADLSPSVQPIASLTNPIDLTGSATDGDFMVAADMIESIDLNPVICSAQKCVVADDRIMLSSVDGPTAT